MANRADHRLSHPSPGLGGAQAGLGARAHPGLGARADRALVGGRAPARTPSFGHRVARAAR
ncbi:hypothetical protein M4J06_003512, partial [Streptomyces coelicoflavus]|uniref:hypothetical protein n=1 Tax=Streptomyces coelicoflavus TaxID=285562 RepID=UPI00210A3CEA